jgi:uncharacterized protein YuzE
MRIMYSADGDALYMYFTSDPKVVRTESLSREVILDFDTHGQLVGLEILGFKASESADELLRQHGIDARVVGVLKHIRQLISAVPPQKELVLA